LYAGGRGSTELPWGCAFSPAYFYDVLGLSPRPGFVQDDALFKPRSRKTAFSPRPHSP
ncbi:hypothetical protein Dimus_035291, partial [Dionaea muscipula]